MNRLSILRGIDKENMELLRPLFKELSFPAGTIIFGQGEPAEFLYLVISGTVDMSFKPYDGGMPMTISHIGKDGLFGWSAVVGSEKYTSSAIAVDAVSTFRVKGSKLRKFCIEHPEAGKTILEHLADGASSRWKDAHKQVKSILLQSLGT